MISICSYAAGMEFNDTHFFVWNGMTNFFMYARQPRLVVTCCRKVKEESLIARK